MDDNVTTHNKQEEHLKCNYMEILCSLFTAAAIDFTHGKRSCKHIMCLILEILIFPLTPPASKAVSPQY